MVIALESKVGKKPEKNPERTTERIPSLEELLRMKNRILQEMQRLQELQKRYAEENREELQAELNRIDEEIMGLEEKLQKLKARRKEIAEILGLSLRVPSTRKYKIGGSIADRIQNYISQLSVGATFTRSELILHCGLNPRSGYIGEILKALEDQNKIRKVGKGVYKKL